MNNLNKGFEDLLSSLQKKDLWLFLSVFDIKMKYRRTVIGPWWETISALIVISVLSFLWSSIFNLDLNEYLPYFSIGYLVWMLITSQINESCEILLYHQNIITNIKLPIFSYILRLAIKNLIVFFHTFVILLPIIFYMFGLKINYFYSLIGLLILFLNLLFLSSLSAVICLRFNDTKFMVSNFLQILFFITPIVWLPGLVRDKVFFLELNPIYHWINIVRDPILSNEISFNSYYVSIITMILFLLLSFYLVGKAKNRISFWY